MSVQAITWAYKQTITPAGLKFVLVTLANYASEDWYCYPSQKKLATMTGQSLRAVNAHLATLEQLGFVRRAHRFRDDGGRTSDGYYLVTPMQNLHTPYAEDADPSCEDDVPPMQNLHTPHAESAPYPKEEPKEDTEEEVSHARARGGTPDTEQGDVQSDGALSRDARARTPSSNKEMVAAWSRTHPQKRR